VGVDTVEAFMASYTMGDYKTMAPAYPPVSVATPGATVGVSSDLLVQLEAEAAARGMTPATLLDMIVREAIEG